MSLKGLKWHVFKLANSDTRPLPTPAELYTEGGCPRMLELVDAARAAYDAMVEYERHHADGVQVRVHPPC